MYKNKLLFSEWFSFTFTSVVHPHTSAMTSSFPAVSPFLSSVDCRKTEIFNRGWLVQSNKWLKITLTRVETWFALCLEPSGGVSSSCWVLEENMKVLQTEQWNQTHRWWSVTPFLSADCLKLQQRDESFLKRKSKCLTVSAVTWDWLHPPQKIGKQPLPHTDVWVERALFQI